MSGTCWLQLLKFSPSVPPKDSLSFRKEAERTAIEERAIQRRMMVKNLPLTPRTRLGPTISARFQLAQ